MLRRRLWPRRPSPDARAGWPRCTWWLPTRLSCAPHARPCARGRGGLFFTFRSKQVGLTAIRLAVGNYVQLYTTTIATVDRDYVTDAVPPPQLITNCRLGEASRRREPGVRRPASRVASVGYIVFVWRVPTPVNARTTPCIYGPSH